MGTPRRRRLRSHPHTRPKRRINRSSCRYPAGIRQAGQSTREDHQVTTIEVRHDVTSTRVDGDLAGYTAKCLNHFTTGLERGCSADDALDRFICDPTEQRFVICAADGTDPHMTDLGGLRYHARHLVEFDHPLDEMQCFRWSADHPHFLQPLTLKCTQPSEFDENDYAHPRYTFTTNTGEAIIDFTCRIDGRA